MVCYQDRASFGLPYQCHGPTWSAKTKRCFEDARDIFILERVRGQSTVEAKLTPCRVNLAGRFKSGFSKSRSCYFIGSNSHMKCSWERETTWYMTCKTFQDCPSWLMHEGNVPFPINRRNSAWVSFLPRRDNLIQKRNWEVVFSLFWKKDQKAMHVKKQESYPQNKAAVQDQEDWQAVLKCWCSVNWFELLVGNFYTPNSKVASRKVKLKNVHLWQLKCMQAKSPLIILLWVVRKSHGIVLPLLKGCFNPKLCAFSPVHLMTFVQTSWT